MLWRKNKLFFLIIILVIAGLNQMYAQSNPKPKKEKFLRHQVSVDAGFHYSKVFNAKRVEYDPNACINLPPNIGCANDAVSFKSNSTTGLNFGLFYTYNLRQYPVFFSAGIDFYNHTQASEGIKDTILKYLPNISNPTYKTYFRSDNIELPIIAGYRINSCHLSLGVSLILHSYQLKKYYFIDETYSENKTPFYNSISSGKYYFCTVSYDFTVKKRHIAPYLGVERISKNEYDFQVGLILPIYNKMKKA